MIVHTAQRIGAGAEKHSHAIAAGHLDALAEHDYPALRRRLGVSDEELEEKRLKKLKLQIKDQMAHIRRAVS